MVSPPSYPVILTKPPGRIAKLQLDKREVIEARLTSRVELQSMALTGLLAAYLALLPAALRLKGRSIAHWARTTRQHLSRPQ